MMHFDTHKHECACNKNLTNVSKSENWQDLENNGCKRCKKNDEYKQAKQLWKEEGGWNEKTIKEARFKPKRYTISEDNINHILRLVDKIHNVEVRLNADNIQEMLLDGIHRKDNLAVEIKQLINKAREV